MLGRVVYCVDGARSLDSSRCYSSLLRGPVMALIWQKPNGWIGVANRISSCFIISDTAERWHSLKPLAFQPPGEGNPLPTPLPLEMVLRADRGAAHLKSYMGPFSRKGKSRIVFGIARSDDFILKSSSNNNTNN